MTHTEGTQSKDIQGKDIQGQTQTHPFPGSGKLLGLDVGLARIGLAVCDPLQLVARPLHTLERASRNEDFARLAHIVEGEEIAGIVCGLPLNMDGSSGPQAKTTRKWAMRLAHALRALLGRSIPIAMHDERLSSFAAQQLAGRWPSGVGEDAVAAAVILQSLLDARRRSRATAGEAASRDSTNEIPEDAIDDEVIQLPLSPDPGVAERRQEG